MVSKRFVGKTLAFAVQGRVLVTVHAACAPDRGEWASACEAYATWPFDALLVVPDPGCPGLDAAERRMNTAALGRRSVPARIAVVSTSRAHRVVITALAFFQKNLIGGFAPDDYRLALRHLDVPVDAWDSLRREALELATSLHASGVVHSLTRAGSQLISST